MVNNFSLIHLICVLLNMFNVSIYIKSSEKYILDKIFFVFFLFLFFNNYRDTYNITCILYMCIYKILLLRIYFNNFIYHLIVSLSKHRIFENKKKLISMSKSISKQS